MNRFKNMRRTKVHTGKRVCKTNSKKDEKAMEQEMKKRKLDLSSMIDRETTETCEEHKKVMVVEMTKTKKNLNLIKERMELTYP